MAGWAGCMEEVMEVTVVWEAWEGTADTAE